MQELIDILRSKGCSLVVRSTTGETTTYSKKGVRDLMWLLDNEPERVRGALVADKVVGKASAGLLVRGGVTGVHAEVMSRQALPLLEASAIPHTFALLVDRIIIPAGDARCPLEQIVANAHTATEVEVLLRQHFQEMSDKRNQTNS